MSPKTQLLVLNLWKTSFYRFAFQFLTHWKLTFDKHINTKTFESLNYFGGCFLFSDLTRCRICYWNNIFTIFWSLVDSLIKDSNVFKKWKRKVAILVSYLIWSMFHISTWSFLRVMASFRIFLFIWYILTFPVLKEQIPMYNSNKICPTYLLIGTDGYWILTKCSVQK